MNEHTMPTPAPPTIVSVTSRLRDAGERERFLETSARFERWLHRQPGFLRDELYAAPGGRYIDTMLWESPSAAERGNELFEGTELRAEFADLVAEHTAFMGTMERLTE